MCLKQLPGFHEIEQPCMHEKLFILIFLLIFIFILLNLEEAKRKVAFSLLGELELLDLINFIFFITLDKM